MAVHLIYGLGFCKMHFSFAVLYCCMHVAVQWGFSCSDDDIEYALWLCSGLFIF
jgi:hypothetical protein